MFESGPLSPFLTLKESPHPKNEPRFLENSPNAPEYEVLALLGHLEHLQNLDPKWGSKNEIDRTASGLVAKVVRGPQHSEIEKKFKIRCHLVPQTSFPSLAKFE